MKHKNLFLILVFVVLAQSILAQHDSVKINKNRLLIAAGGVFGGIGASYWFVQKSWWKETQIDFLFVDGADLKYALNVDKVGHFLGGVASNELFSSSMKWAGMGERNALWFGALFGSSLQLAIEMKDAYAPYWGFSKWDLALGSAGSLWPVAQYYNNDLNAIDVKISYYKHSNIYWELDRQRGKDPSKYAWQDDYPNQTYWLAFNINHFMNNDFLPEWLNIAIGFGLDDTQYLDESFAKTGGKNEWYLALDYDINKLLKTWDSP